MRKIKLIAATVGTSLLIVGISAALPAQTRPQPAFAGAGASNSVVFDHSNCQYPDRWSNPANGCDNSDPAVPECIKAFSTKAGEDACIAAFVQANEQPAAVNTPAPISTAPNQCGGK